MIVITGVSQESVAVRASAVQNLVHDDVDNEAGSSCAEHDKWLFHKLLVSDSEGGLVEDVEQEDVDDEKVGQGSQKFHSMVAEGHLLGGRLLGEIEEEEGEDEADEVGDQVDGV